jgi:Tol biopolymer transport system component
MRSVVHAAVAGCLLCACGASPGVRAGNTDRDAQASARSSTAQTDIQTRRVWSGPDVDNNGSPAPDGRALSFIDWKANALMIRDVETGQVRQVVKGIEGSSFDGPIFSPDGKQLAYGYAIPQGRSELRIVDVTGANARVVYTNDQVRYLHTIDWSPEGRSILVLLFGRNNTNQMALVSVGDGAVRVLKSFDSRSPNNAGFSPDARLILYDLPEDEKSRSSDIFMIAADGSAETAVVKHPAHDLFLGWIPNTENILFASDRTGTLAAWRQRVSGSTPGEPVLVKSELWQLWQPLGFSRNGTFFYSVQISSEQHFAATIDRATGKLTSSVLAEGAGASLYSSGGAVSADGRWRAHIRWPGLHRPEKFTLVVQSVETGESREMALPLRGVALPQWFPDGGSLLVHAYDEKGQPGVFRIDARTGDVALIRQRAAFPLVSHDGRTVYVTGGAAEGQERRWTIIARDVESGNEREVYRDRRSLGASSLSPDGKQLAVFARDSGNNARSTLLLLSAAGGPPRELMRMPEPLSVHFLSAPVWLKDGGHLLVIASETTGKPNATQLWRVSLQDGTAENLNIDLKGALRVSLHPDGQRIYFTGGSIDGEVWVMENLTRAG